MSEPCTQRAGASYSASCSLASYFNRHTSPRWFLSPDTPICKSPLRLFAPYTMAAATSHAKQRCTQRLPLQRLLAANVVENARKKSQSSKAVAGTDVLIEELHGGIDPKHNSGIPSEDNATKVKHYTEIFDRLDSDNSGAISPLNIHTEMERLNVPEDQRHHVERILAEFGVDEASVELESFLQYCEEKERLLKQVFDVVDFEQDGCLNIEEVRAALQQLNIEAGYERVEKMMSAVDSCNNGQISWFKWRESMMLAPTAHVEDVFKYWVLISENQEDEVKSKWYHHVIAGGLSGLVSRSCTAPLDRLKIIMAANANTKITLVGGFRDMLKEGGFWSMWRGNGVNVLKITPETALKFWAWETAKSTFYSSDDIHQVLWSERLMAGATAGLVAQGSIFPFEVLKTRLATAKTGQYRGIVHCAHQIYSTKGIRGFYRGITPAMLGVMPYASVDLAVYETLRSKYYAYVADNDAQPHDIGIFACGTISSGCGQLLSYPLALVRMRLQANPDNPNNMLQEFRSVVQQGGFTALFRGLQPNVLKVVPAMSIGYVIYERVKRQLMALN